MTPNPQLHIGISEAPRGEEKKKKYALPQGNMLERVNMWVIMRSPVKTSELAIFYRLFATMVNAGLNILKALSILQDQTENPKLKIIVAGIVTRVEKGLKLSDAMAEYEDVFDESAIGVVKAGEASGRLNIVLNQLADQLEKSTKITAKVKGALIYPVAIILMMFAAAIVVMVFVIPKLKELFESAKVELPLMTRVLIKVSNAFVGETMSIPNWILFILTAVFVVLAIRFWTKTDRGKYLWHLFILHLPVFGDLIKKVSLSKFCRGLASLTASGVSIIKTLKIVADGVGNEVYRRRIYLIADDVKKGITMGDNLSDEKKLFPSMVVSMIEVGEKTAQLHKITEKVADFYEEEVDRKVANFSKLMEPIIILILGIGVGGLVAAIMLPIMKIAQVASQG